MKPIVDAATELRVLLRTPTAKDAAMAQAVLAPAGIEACSCPDLESVVRELEHCAGALLLAEEVLVDAGISKLARVLRAQPTWSDLPIVLLARQGADSNVIAGAMDMLDNVTVMERPMRVASLVSALRSALRARRRQYELRAHLAGLKEADRRKNEFLATLAHELRNPMAPLRTALAILDRKSPDPQAARHYYGIMARQIDHMVRLVDDLMEVSRITRGKIELQLGLVTLDRVIQEAVELSRPLLDAGRHRLEVRSQVREPLTVMGDRVRLAQVFANLLNNAAKYTPHEGRIEVVTQRAGAQAVVTVSDNGSGIEAEMLSQVFGMFVQASGTTSAAQGGLGIGLTLVQSLVELHGGSVVARSRGLGEGSEFVVTLPLAQPDASQGEAAAPPPPQGAVTANVLIVDDNRDAADSLAEVLGLLGARTSVAYSGADALRIAATANPSIAILDIGMPGMNGCELAEQLRADPRHQGLRLIALTGWGQERHRERIASAGFTHHLLKPVDIGELTALLHQLAGSDKK
jgi:signal transduction histidine kinase/ActR/RegA family two-component response regulator